MTAVLISTLYTRPNLTRGDEPVGGERLGGGRGRGRRCHGRGNGMASGTGGKTLSGDQIAGGKTLNISGEADVVQSWKSLSA